MASASDIEKAINSVIGKNDDESTVRHFLDSGFPPLNNASASGWDSGFPVGRMIEIAGPPSSGKTALATFAMSAAQKLGGIAAFADHERSFSMILAEKIGLDIKPGKFIFKKPRTFEESLQMCVMAATIIRAKKMIPKDAPICWVFDSLASMVPQSALYEMKSGKVVGMKSLEDRNMNDNSALARATSNAFPAFAQHCEELGICAIFLNQMRMKIGVMFGDPRKTTGGQAPEFYFSQRLWLSAKQVKVKNEVTGMEVTGKFVKNKVSRPFQEATWRFMFQKDGTGRFDTERSLVEFLHKEGRFDATGADGKAAKDGSVIWNGTQIARESLARKIEKDGAFAELMKLLPDKYEPPVVAVAGFEEEEDQAEAA